jgi:hypothetical protein
VVNRVGTPFFQSQMFLSSVKAIRREESEAGKVGVGGIGVGEGVIVYDGVGANDDGVASGLTLNAVMDVGVGGVLT